MSLIINKDALLDELANSLKHMACNPREVSLSEGGVFDFYGCYAIKVMEWDSVSIRVREGDIVHCNITIKTASGQHYSFDRELTVADEDERWNDIERNILILTEMVYGET